MLYLNIFNKILYNIEFVLPYAQAEGQRILGDNFIYQQANIKSHTYQKSLGWCKENLKHFIDNHRWPPNSSDLNVLNYYVWDAITINME